MLDLKIINIVIFGVFLSGNGLAQWPTPCLIFNQKEFRDQDGATLPDNAIVQILWAGLDRAINPPLSYIGTDDNGKPTGDDIILKMLTVGTGQPGGTGKIFYTLTIQTDTLLRPLINDLIYLRVFNGPNLVTAEHCGDSQLYRCRGEVGEAFIPELDMDYLPFELHLASFLALADTFAINLNWETTAEQSVWGFNILRLDRSDSSYRKINMMRIRAKGSTSTGGRYQYQDRSVAVNVEYFYQLEAIGLDGQSAYFGPTSAMISVKPGPGNRILLYQNYPNPVFAEMADGGLLTCVPIYVPEAIRVNLVVYDVLGKKIRTLINESLAGGSHQITWDGKNDQGITVPGGIYFYKLTAGSTCQIRKMLIIR